MNMQEPWGYDIVDPLRDLWFGTSGPLNAEIAIVGESWGVEEARKQLPFVGSSGQEYDRMLAESGLSGPFFRTNVFSARPKDDEAWHFFHSNQNPSGRPLYAGLDPSLFAISEIQRLYRQLAALPNLRLVIATGNYALWALTCGLVSTSATSTGNGVTVRVPGGIISWRGSMLRTNPPPLDESSSTLSIRAVPLLPIIHPAAILRAWYQRAMTVEDLRRAKKALTNDWEPKPPPQILIPSYAEAVDQLEEWIATCASGPMRLANDIETYQRRFITCVGFATGPYDSTGYAMVLPFVRLVGKKQIDSYWTPDEELHLTKLVRTLLSHPNCLVEGQNYIYDIQYLKERLGIVPNLSFDTMLAHHLLFPGTPKALDYLSSLYCHYHTYWKDDNKEWDTSADETKHLIYNGVDVLRTYEVATVLRRLVVEMKQSEQWEWEKRKHDLALRMMFKGVRIDTGRRAQYGFELLACLGELRQRLATLLAPQLIPEMKSKTAKPWYQSTRQQAPIFYDILGLPRQRNRKTGNASVDDEALLALKDKFPELSTLFDMLLESRSVQVFYSNFVSAPLETSPRMKGRIVTSFNPAGTETFRWSSSENAFGRGTGLQNVPVGEEE